MKLPRILFVSAFFASVITSSFASLIEVKTELFSGESHIAPGSSFDLVVRMQPMVSDSTVMTDFGFEFISENDAFRMDGFTMLKPFDARVSSLPSIEGVADVFDPTFFSGAPVDLVSLQLTAVGSAGTHSVMVEGLLASLQGAYFVDQNLDFFEGDVSASAPLTIRVPDHASTGLMLFGVMGAFAILRVRNRR